MQVKARTEIVPLGDRTADSESAIEEENAHDARS